MRLGEGGKFIFQRIKGNGALYLTLPGLNGHGYERFFQVFLDPHVGIFDGDTRPEGRNFGSCGGSQAL